MDPKLTSVHHVALNVQDLERSAGWYCDVLGFERLFPFEGDGFDRVLVRHASGVVLGLTRHDDPEARAPFNERHSGLDHLAFSVATREELESWCVRFDEMGVVHSGIAKTPVTGSSLLAFRDPDNLALEMYVAAGATTR